MPREVICPTCGRALSVDDAILSPDPDAPPMAARTTEVVIPTTSTSADDLAPFALPEAGSDIEAVAYGGSTPASLFQEPIEESIKQPRNASARINGMAHAERPLTPDPLSTLNLDASAPLREERLSSSNQYSDEQHWPRSSRWLSLIIASYASALTMGCLWLAMTGRIQFRTSVANQPVIEESSPEPAARADQSAALIPAPPIAADRMTTLGKPLRIGSLELTPLSLEAQRVVLQHALPGGRRREMRNGGPGALALRIRVRNVSNDVMFAPLDEAFMRERDHGLPDSFIEVGQNVRIYIYPLAIHSEWSILGQTFPVLKPGEMAETIVVSSPGATDQLADPMIWRLRLRTEIDQTEVVGVRFQKDEIDPDGF